MSEFTKGVWPCARPGCDQVLGRIAFSEIAWEEGVKGSTDGVNVVFICPKCGTPKVWFSKPRDRYRAALESLSSEIARQVLKELKQIQE